MPKTLPSAFMFHTVVQQRSEFHAANYSVRQACVLLQRCKKLMGKFGTPMTAYDCCTPTNNSPNWCTNTASDNTISQKTPSLFVKVSTVALRHLRVKSIKDIASLLNALIKRAVCGWFTPNQSVAYTRIIIFGSSQGKRE